MSHGKDAARDLRYGRRGGRWAASGAGSMLLELEREKVTHVRESGGSCGCRLCRPDLHPEIGQSIPQDAEAWAATARMAHARLAAGVPLSDLDLEAIRRYPRTPSLWPDGEPYGPAADADEIPDRLGRDLAPDPGSPTAVGGEEPSGFDAAVDGSERAAGRWTDADKALVDSVIADLAATLPRFTADDVWRLIDGRVPVTKGLTSRLVKAQRDGLIVNTGQTAIADRGGEHDHAQRLSVWASTRHDLEETA